MAINSRYTVEKCSVSDIAAVMKFFGENHDSSHVLASNRQFVDWQYYVPDAEQYNILIAKDESGILGLLAYIPNTFFDRAIPRALQFIWTANWLVKKAYKGFVGLDLFYSLPKYENCEALGIVGLTDEAGMFYEKMGYRVGKLDQYFFVNQHVNHFKILSGYEHTGRQMPCVTNDTRHLSPCVLSSPLILEYINASKPYKSRNFFEKKYVKNPFYKYFLYGITVAGEVAAVLVCRVVQHNGTNVVRLVEYIGRAEYLAEARLQDILEDHNAEYIDFYCAGISHDTLSQAGFLLNTGARGLIVPSYFEPFQNTNIEIAYAYRFPACCIFKGDGDRDHPR